MILLLATIDQSLHALSVLMHPTQANSREFLQQAIDAEIKALEESIQANTIKSLRALKLRRNALQPISSLPPEIFGGIFSTLCLPGIPSQGGMSSGNIARLCISHVCHQWREIALNQSQLWSHINFNTVSLAGATEFLVRAKLAPLYMEMRVSQYDGHLFHHFLKEVQVHLPHVRHLSISAEFIRTSFWELANTLVSPAPTLEYLSLSCREDGNKRTGDVQLFVPDLQVLFGGSAPRLSCLKLRHCNISWDSPLLKGLKHLEILTPLRMARPTLAVWLDTLDELPQLKSLTLHSASPFATHFPFAVKRTVTLPSLTHLDISASLRDFALASAHLVLPALTSLCFTATDHLTIGSSVQAFLPYIVRHVHGPQDILPLQSVLICNHLNYDGDLRLLAWSVPDVDTFVHDPPAFLGAILPTRAKLSFRAMGNAQLDILQKMMVALPLDSLLTLVAVDLNIYTFQGPPIEEFWLRLMPNWPLLRHVRLAPIALRGFIKALLEDCKNPLLPSLTELVLANSILEPNLTLSLRDVLMKRVELGVPLETLDLRMCRRNPYNLVAVQLLSDIAVDIIRPFDVLGPEDTEESRGAGLSMFAKMLTMWEPLVPYPCYSGDEDSEFEESEDENDDDDEDDYDDEGDSNNDEDEDEENENDDDEDADDYVPDND